MANPIIVDDIPNMTDADLLAAYELTDGTGDTAEALLPEMKRRGLDI